MISMMKKKVLVVLAVIVVLAASIGIVTFVNSDSISQHPKSHEVIDCTKGGIDC
jgi:flagellar basal body-associated protein FliL